MTRAVHSANIDVAMNVMDRILSQDPDNLEILRRSMKLNYQRQRFTDSLNRAQELLEIKPDDAEAPKYVGLCKDFENKYTEAAESYRLSIKNAPQDPETYALLADLLKDQLDQPEEADKVMDEMVAANDQTALAYLARAYYLLDLDRTDQASRRRRPRCRTGSRGSRHLARRGRGRPSSIRLGRDPSPRHARY